MNTYRVQAGDTTASIASRWTGDPLRGAELLRVNPQKKAIFNGYQWTFVPVVGETIRVPWNAPSIQGAVVSAVLNRFDAVSEGTKGAGYPRQGLRGLGAASFKIEPGVVLVDSAYAEQQCGGWTVATNMLPAAVNQAVDINNVAAPGDFNYFYLGNTLYKASTKTVTSVDANGQTVSGKTTTLETCTQIAPGFTPGGGLTNVGLTTGGAAAAAPPSNKTPYIIGGVAIAAGLGLAWYLSKQQHGAH